MNDIYLKLKRPLVLIGIGGAGSKVAVESSKSIDCECILISNDKKDLNLNYRSIFIDSEPWINPTCHKLRSFAQFSSNEIRSELQKFQTLIVISNLAGNAGTAITPVVEKLARQHSPTTTIISFVIMPFKFEKERIFQSGISLKRIRDFSDAVIVMDNDALLDNYPDLSPEECFEITNVAMRDVIDSISKGFILPDMNLLYISKNYNDSAELSINDSIGMLYHNTDPELVNRALLYVMGGKRVPNQTLNLIVQILSKIFKNEGTATIAMTMCDSNKIGIHMMAAIDGKTRFDKYDPLSDIIPERNFLDWEDMDTSPDIEMRINNVE